jgi:hypothetical protein
MRGSERLLRLRTADVAAAAKRAQIKQLYQLNLRRRSKF